MKSVRSSSTGAGSNIAASLEVALRDLAFAVKSLQLYPSTSPVVKGAIERSHRSFAPLLATGYVRLDITPGSIRVEGLEVGSGTQIVEQLSRRMHSRGIAKLRFDGHLEPGSLQVLSEIVATEPNTIEELGGIEKLFEDRQPRGVLVEFLELDRLFADEQEDEEENVWEAILKGYRSAANEDDEVDWDALATSLDRLQDFVSWLATNLDAISERTGYENIDVMRFVLDRLGTISSALTSDHINLLVLAVRQAFDEFDPDLLVDLLADPIEIDTTANDSAGISELSVADFLSGAPSPSPEGKTIDIGTYIARGLDPGQAERLILHTLRTRQPSTPRLYGLFDRLTSERPERGQIAQHVKENLGDEVARGEAHSEFLANWPRLFDVLNGEAPQRFLSLEYEAGLQQLLGPVDLDNAWPIERIIPRLSEMSTSFISLRKSLMVARLLDHDIDDASYKRLALELERLLQSLLDEGQFRTLNKLLRELVEASRDDDRAAARREISEGIVDRFYTAETFQALVKASLRGSHQEVAVIMAMIRARGTHAIPLLLDALADEKARRVRQRLLSILSEMGTEVGDLVVERFDDDRWFVLRNLAMILGEVGDPSMVEQLSPMFEHADARVRQEAIASTIKLGGLQAAPLLMRALGDEDSTAFLMAIHGLGYHGDAGGVTQLRKLVKTPNFRGQSTDLVQTVAIALGRLSDEQSRGVLTRLARAPWFFRERREAARDAAAWALAALDAKPTRKAPVPRMLADLQPGSGSPRFRLRGHQTTEKV